MCPRCGSILVWGSDFTFEDYGYEGNGLVSNYSCCWCGVDVEIRYPEDIEE